MEVLNLLERHRIDDLVVVDERGVPVGIVDSQDLTKLKLSMSESFLRYTDLATAIQIAKSNGMTNARIVRALSANMNYTETLALARGGAAVRNQGQRIHAPAPEPLRR